MKCHTHILLTNPWHRKEESKNDNLSRINQESLKNFEQNCFCWLLETMQTNILHSVKNRKQDCYKTLDISPEFLALMALLFARIDYRDGSMPLRGGSYSPVHTVLICTYCLLVP